MQRSAECWLYLLVGPRAQAAIVKMICDRVISREGAREVLDVLIERSFAELAA